MTSTSKIRELLTSRVYASHDFLLFITNKLNSSLHQHPALQLNISLSGETIGVDNEIDQLQGTCIVIGSNQPHRISSHCRWQAVLLLAQQSSLACNLQRYFLSNGQFGCAVTNAYIEELRLALISLIQKPEHMTTLDNDIYIILKTLNNITAGTPGRPNQHVVKIFNQLDKRHSINIPHTKLAAAVSLSDSHLSHLFREETGATLRRYKLWQKTLSGANYILEGKTITEASLESGFADTAHFSRSFKRQFGILPSELKQHSQEVFWIDGDSEALLATKLNSANAEDTQRDPSSDGFYARRVQDDE